MIDNDGILEEDILFVNTAVNILIQDLGASEDLMTESLVYILQILLSLFSVLVLVKKDVKEKEKVFVTEVKEGFNLRYIRGGRERD